LLVKIIASVIDATMITDAYSTSEHRSGSLSRSESVPTTVNRPDSLTTSLTSSSSGNSSFSLVIASV